MYEMLKIVVQFIIYPGLISTCVFGLFFVWVDRKLFARLQGRIGPPIYQPFADFIKLLTKHSILPSAASKNTYVIAPVLGLAAIATAILFIPIGSHIPTCKFGGDLIVVFYLLTIPAIAEMLGGFSSGNPYSVVGSSRQMELIIGYELPFAIALVTFALKAGSFSLEKIVEYQLANGWFIGRLPFASIAFILCMFGKLKKVPFDIPEAETEIAGGTLIEYSGAPLSLFKLNHAMEWFAMSSLAIVLFLGASGNIATHLIKCLLLVVIISIGRAINPRTRVLQAQKFYWLIVSPIALIDLIRVLVGG
jgi:formate hydrogenlyase subunit 4